MDAAAAASLAPHGASRAAESASLEDLPNELLERVLGRLPVAELVRARRVSRRWRAVVERLREQDRKYIFACGGADLRRVRQLPYTRAPSISEYDEASVPCTCGALVWSNASAKFALGCGDGDPDIAGPQPYGRRHDLPYPPARWALLAPERALALVITEACARTDARLGDSSALRRGPQDGPHPVEHWAPSVIYLPDSVVRPTSASGLWRLVHALLDPDWRSGRGPSSGDGAVAALFRRLASPAEADAFYERQVGDPPYWRQARPESSSTEWEVAWTSASVSVDAGRGLTTASNEDSETSDFSDGEADVDEFGDAELAALLPCYSGAEQWSVTLRDPSLWDQWRFNSRQLAAAWRVALVRRQGKRFRRFRLGFGQAFPFVLLSNDGITDYLDANVRNIDLARDLVVSRCSPCIMYKEPGSRRLWVGGLSSAGHLVGAFVNHFVRD